MKFNQYVSLREAEEAQEIDAIFNRTSQEINQLFTQLTNKTAEMVKNYERAGLPEELQKQIIQDLTRIAQKVKGHKPNNAMTDPRGPAQELPKTENVMIDTYIKSIAELITEAEAASIVQGLGSHGTGVGGKKAYDFRSAITNVHRLVMDRMAQLKDAVLQNMGIIRDTHKRLGGVRNAMGGVRNRLDDLGTQMGTGFDKLSNPPQPFQGREADATQDSMIALQGAANGGFHVKLVGYDGTEISINPKSDQWKQQVLRLGQRHKVFKIVGPKGEQEEINIGNPDQVHQLLNAWGYKSTSNWTPSPVKKGRALGLRDPQTGKVVKDEE